MSYCYFVSIFSWVYSISQGSVLLLRAGDQLTEQQPLSMLLNLPLPSTMSGASCNKRTRDNWQWHSCRQRNIIITHSFSAFSSKVVHDVFLWIFIKKIFSFKSWWDSAEKSIGYLFANTPSNPSFHLQKLTKFTHRTALLAYGSSSAVLVSYWFSY